MTELHAPAAPGVYEDAAGALYTVHFADHSDQRLLIEPLASSAGVDVQVPAIAARGPYTAYLPLTSLDRRRLAIAARFYATLAARRHDDVTAEVYQALAARMDEQP